MNHRACGGHSAYRLTCLEFETMRQARCGECAICDLPAVLEIDHDHAIGLTAVRGLVCRPCNNRLAEVDMGERPPTAAESYYLRHAWHLTNRTTHLADGRTPIRNFRADDPQWERWEQAATAQGQTVSDYLRDLADREADRRLGKKRTP